jgi:membrane associated rhomboid family serine protease
LSATKISVKAVVLITAMVLIAIVTCVAMLNGHDGAAFTGALGAIVTISGYLFLQMQKEKEQVRIE